MEILFYSYLQNENRKNHFTFSAGFVQIAVYPFFFGNCGGYWLDLDEAFRLQPKAAKLVDAHLGKKHLVCMRN